MDELVIDNTPVHITGPNGPAIEVIRYDGHHHQLPDEQSVYRGPMIVVRNGGTFTAENIAFHGGAGSHVTHVVREGAATYDAANLNANANLDGSGNLQFYSYTAGGKTLDKLPDTNRVYAPIILATGTGSSVNLREGALVQHNWNEYGSLSGQTDGNGMPTDASLMGAISVTDGARLTLGGNVTVENNFSHTMTGLDDLTHDSISIQKAPGGGAIYVDGGTVELPESNRNTAIDITRNYLMNPIIDSDPSAVTWWDEVVIDGVPERYIIDTADLRTWPRANVLLTREAASGTHYEQVMNDTQSDMIVVSGTVGDETKIGVRKWFPGIHERDTIRFATVVGGNNTVLANAVRENENFVSDDHFSIFYNPSVNLINAYLFRCATFRHQLASDMYIGPLYERDNTLTLASGDVLHFGVKNNVCPTGGDSIIYRVQGGMMPYTYTWTDLGKSTTIQTTTTPYSNAQVQYDLAGGENGTAVTGDDRYAKYAASIADTLLLPNEAITTATSSVWNHLLVSVTDATGECALYKNIDLRILMDHEAANPATYWPKATAAADTASHRDNSSPWMSDTVGSGWTDTARSVLAIASRNFSGVQITPRVWVDRSNGTISATVAGADNDYVYQYVGESESHELADLNFCPGDTIYLYTEPRGSTNKFIMWDFDPYYRPLALYTVPAHDATVTAYYGPDEYWSEHVNSVATAHAAYDDNYYYAGNNGNSYVTTLHGDVHIYDENGLAWFISVVNGLNGAQARQFYFNKVFLHQKSGGYDMKNYLWTPVGTNHQPFRGWFLGVGSNATDTVRLRDEQVVIKNIIVNEPNMNYTGFFGNIDTARICGIKLESALIRGSQYVGTVAACSKDAQLDNVVVADSAELSSATTILATNYTSGGMIGKSTHDVVTNVSVKAKFIGDAVYSGGMVGYGVSTTVTNSYGYNDNRMNGLYIGGVAGYLDGTAGSKGGLFRKSKSASPSVVANNFVRLENSEGTRVGGIAGYAKNSEIENNYFYGDINNAGGSGVASSLNHSNADGNYYEQGAAKQSVGSSINGSYVDNISTFEGAGNGVTLAQSVHGRNNLTRVLNAWVREQNAAGGDYHTWRSDLESTNGGYPIFGTPDLIPLRDSMTVYGCDSVEWNGNYYADGETMSYRVIDTVEMVDSMMTIHFAAHFSSHEQYADSALVGEAYSGYGFTLTAAETALLQSTVENYGFATLVLSDTLATEYGCDSIITLTLTFYANVSIPQVTKSHVLVYPNPTTARVTVEAESMKHVELYDNDGRRLADYDTYGNDEITIDIKHYSTGIYYLRVHAADGVTIQKLIKK